jgi:hypothetical protein
MIALLMTMALCGKATIINDTKEWTAIDEQSLATAKPRCAELYPEAPCLKIFHKTEENVYRVVCGGETK